MVLITILLYCINDYVMYECQNYCIYCIFQYPEFAIQTWPHIEGLHKLPIELNTKSPIIHVDVACLAGGDVEAPGKFFFVLICI